MNEMVLVESDKKKQIYQILETYGITEKIIIDNEAEDMILLALSENDIESVSIDKEGGLVIAYAGGIQ